MWFGSFLNKCDIQASTATGQTANRLPPADTTLTFIISYHGQNNGLVVTTQSKEVPGSILLVEFAWPCMSAHGFSLGLLVSSNSSKTCSSGWSIVWRHEQLQRLWSTLNLQFHPIISLYDDNKDPFLNEWAEDSTFPQEQQTPGHTSASTSLVDLMVLPDFSLYCVICVLFIVQDQTPSCGEASSLAPSCLTYQYFEPDPCVLPLFFWNKCFSPVCDHL